jgi:hypothetical protein
MCCPGIVNILVITFPRNVFSVCRSSVSPCFLTTGYIDAGTQPTSCHCDRRFFLFVPVLVDISPTRQQWVIPQEE